MTNYTLDLKPIAKKLTDKEFEELCASNPELKLEYDALGNLIIMSPTGSESGNRNLKLAFQVELWNDKNKLGVTFDSSTGFKLSNGATRSPDVTWISLSRWNSLSKKEQRGFAPIDPDFVIELKSPTDNLQDLQDKMQEYMSCGVKLGWLINPDELQVEIYRQGKDREILDNPSSLSGENIMLVI